MELLMSSGNVHVKGRHLKVSKLKMKVSSRGASGASSRPLPSYELSLHLYVRTSSFHTLFAVCRERVD